jgi:hypothetical protein
MAKTRPDGTPLTPDNRREPGATDLLPSWDRLARRFKRLARRFPGPDFCLWITDLRREAKHQGLEARRAAQRAGARRKVKKRALDATPHLAYQAGKQAAHFAALVLDGITKRAAIVGGPKDVVQRRALHAEFGSSSGPAVKAGLVPRVAIDDGDALRGWGLLLLRSRSPYFRQLGYVEQPALASALLCEQLDAGIVTAPEDAARAKGSPYRKQDEQSTREAIRPVGGRTRLARPVNPATASERQLAALRRFRVSLRSGLTAGEASDALAQAIARARESQR